MQTYEIHVSNITMMVEADSEGDAVTNAEQFLMESVWDYGSIGVA